MTRIPWPQGKDFAFTIVDDTDHAITANVGPVYGLLSELGFRTTKTVWVLPTTPDAHYALTDTLENEAYREFILGLQDQGFEIALHGVRGCSSTREVIQTGLQRFEEVLGAPPSMHINHAYNADNLHWGSERLAPLRRKLRLYGGTLRPSSGHIEGSPHYWADLAAARIRYVRGYVFDEINTLACDPVMPYHDALFPAVPAWFSSSNGARFHDFMRLLAPENQDRLRDENGLCIVYTHFGTPGFLDSEGNPQGDFAASLGRLADMNGWFAPASEILDFLRGPELRQLAWSHRGRLALSRLRTRLSRALGRQ